MNQSELGLRIKQCRRKQKLTQEKLAELIDVSPHYIYEIEKGLKTMSLSTFTEISQVLNISTDYLLFGQAANVVSQHTDTHPPDRLSELLQNQSINQRENIADILSVLLPKLK